jgi:hypothetical protein
VLILLGSFLLAASVPGAQRLYGIVAVAVMFWVVTLASSRRPSGHPAERASRRAAGGVKPW